jgi:N-methylhydantoinase A/oxoprolinase/acetone carboxylase beta subunit
MTGPVRIGIDVGGTNTDAVAVSGREILGWVKCPTTPQVADGILDALTSVLAKVDIAPADVSSVMVGTTQFVNAVVQSSGLARTAVVRLGLPATACLPPLVDWPPALRGAVAGSTYLCAGGLEYDGTEIVPLDRARLREIALQIADAGAESVAITSVFSPLDARLESEAAAMILERSPGVHVTLSSDIGRIGLLERENATAMNACLRVLAAATVDSFESALSEIGIAGNLFISQNDGTLMSADFARRMPVATFASGPTNSMRGAAFLSGLLDAAGGVRTNFRMPDVLSLGLGGGSYVRQSDSGVTVGPDSVGYAVRSLARVFGGPVLTATDLAVAGHRAEVGDPGLVDDVSEALVDQGLALVEARIAETVDRMKLSAGDLPVVVVGGGSFLVGDSLPGASVIVRPEQGSVANAIGAAMAQAGGEVDRIVQVELAGRRRAVDGVIEEAVGRAVAAGADPATVEVVDLEEIPVSYLPGTAVRVRAKAVGDLLVGDGP